MNSISTLNYQSSQQYPRIMHPPSDCAGGQVPRLGNLGNAVSQGEPYEGVNGHIFAPQARDYSQILEHEHPLVGLLSADYIQVVTIYYPILLHEHTEGVTHDNPAPCQHGSALIVAVTCLYSLEHRVGGKVFGTLFVVGVVVPGYCHERPIHPHDLFIKVHGS